MRSKVAAGWLALQALAHDEMRGLLGWWWACFPLKSFFVHILMEIWARNHGGKNGSLTLLGHPSAYGKQCVTAWQLPSALLHVPTTMR